MTAEPAIRLSFCITTRNRAGYIGETLANLAEQCPADVEVVVVDGASTDRSVEVIREVASRYPQIRLIAQTQNSGLDADYDRAVGAARGEYCWLFSDDDLIAPGAVATVLAACEKKPAVIIVDASVHTADFGELIAEGRLPKDGPTVYPPQQGQQFFADCARHLTFIGCVILRKDLWTSRERERYYGSEFIHVGVLFQAPLPGDVVVIRQSLVRIRHGLGNWLGRWFQVWGIKWPRLIWSFDWIDESIRAAVNEREPWSRAKYLMASRAGRRYGWKQFRELVREADRPSKLVAPLLFAAVPWWGAYATIAADARLRSVVRFIGRRRRDAT